MNKLLEKDHRIIFFDKNWDFDLTDSTYIKALFSKILSLFSQNKKEIIFENIEENLAFARRRDRLLLGKPKKINVTSIYDEHKETIMNCLAKGMDNTNISKFIGVGSPRSLSWYIKGKNLKDSLKEE
jgi:DNA invertase Pin-like site-specific DNA recombinase